MRRILILSLLLLASSSLASERALDLIGQGGSNDNIFQQRDGSTEKESSAFGRITAVGWLGWNAGGSDDKIYAFGVSDSKIQTTTEKAASSYIDIGPGYRSKMMGGMFEIDSSLHIFANFAGDNEEQITVDRTRSARTGAPSWGVSSPFTIFVLPSSFTGYGLDFISYLQYGGGKFGPELRLQQKNYSKVKQGDFQLLGGIIGEFPVSKNILLDGELGFVSTSSTIEDYGSSGMLAILGANIDAGSGYLITADMQYETREFTGDLVRTDSITLFHGGLEKLVLKDFVLLFDFYSIDNNSTVDLFRYTNNVLAIGLKWMIL